MAWACDVSVNILPQSCYVTMWQPEATYWPLSPTS